MRKKLTEQEKKQRQEFLKKESPEERTKRVINPKIIKVQKAIASLTKSINSPRYKFTEEQKEKILVTLQEESDLLTIAFEKATPKKVYENVI